MPGAGEFTMRGEVPADPAALPTDNVGALIVGPVVLADGSGHGPLSGRTFVAKDLFDVAGWPTGAGNPDWLAAARPADRHADAVQLLLTAGASLIGKAHSDELAFSLSGNNMHYGAPANSAAPGRLPGGSSSGSAAAVAAGLTDLGLGSDTGGSIRVPASYCGLLGHRPTHGRVSLAGAVALAPSFDTAGLLAPSGALLRSGMLALLDGGVPAAAAGQPVRRLLVARDAVDQLDDECRREWEASLAAFDLPLTEVVLTEGDEGLSAWRTAFQALQAAEAWAVQGRWFDEQQPRVSPDVESRFRAGSAVTAATLAEANQVRAGARSRLAALLGPGDALVLPSACGVAPPLDLQGAPLDHIRHRTLNLTCTAGLTGAPAVSLPLARFDGRPIGVCLLGLPGQDEALLDLAARVLP